MCGYPVQKDGSYNAGRCIISIGSWVKSYHHAGYIRDVDYENRLAWVSDGDGTQCFRFDELYVPK